eukprot:XP_011666466.1 PREDICTED: uncharacterized protein LOC105439315 [Strongylocentrotus purpuratus]
MKQKYSLVAHPNPFQVRLADGYTTAEGRVEILYDGSWGTICDAGWDLRDANVVCSMLGFDRALDAPKSAKFGQGSGRSLLANVRCEGTEDNLADCANAVIRRYACSDTLDAEAICYSGKSIVLGISIPVSSIVLITAFVYCLCRTLKRRAKKNIDTAVYMDLMHSRSVDLQNLDSIYQDLSSPPKLPERLSAVVSSRKNISQVALTVNQNTTGEQVHIMGDNEQNATIEHIDITTIHERPSSSNGADIGGYLLPTATPSEPRVYMEIDEVASDYEIRMSRARHINKQDAIHKYMDMKPIGQNPTTGTDVDLDGYLLQSSTALRSELTPVVTRRAACVSYSGNDKIIRRTRHSDKQDAIHEDMGMKHVNQKPSTDTDRYLDGYLPTTRTTKSGSKSEVCTIRGIDTIDQTSPTDKHKAIDGYLLPTSTASNSECTPSVVTTAANVTENDVRTTRIRARNIQDIDQKYIDMNIVYQKPASGSDFDVDGYLLPVVRSADADQDVDGYLLPSVTPYKSEVIPNIRAISIGLTDSDNKGSLKGTLRSSRQDGMHEYMDIKSVYQEPPGVIYMDPDGYPLSGVTCSGNELSVNVTGVKRCYKKASVTKEPKQTQGNDIHEYMGINSDTDVGMGRDLSVTNGSRTNCPYVKEVRHASLIKGSTATELHEYMDMTTVYEAASADKEMDPDCIGDSTISTHRNGVPTNSKMAVTAISLGDDKLKVARSSQEMQYDINAEYTNITTA